MIASELYEYELNKYNLGGRSPPKEVEERLLKLRGKLKAIWNETKWEIYRTDSEPWLWQCTFPFKEITPAIIPWLQKRDTSNYGRDDDEARQKRFKEYFRNCQQEDKERQLRLRDNSGILLELKDRIRFIADRSYYGVRRSTGIAGAKRMLKPGPVVGVNLKTGKAIRAYKK